MLHYILVNQPKKCSKFGDEGSIHYFQYPLMAIDIKVCYEEGHCK